MMWPDLFGPGWGWTLSSALGLLSFVVIVVLALDDLAAARERLERAETAESVIWPRHDGRDFTR